VCEDDLYARLKGKIPTYEIWRGKIPSLDKDIDKMREEGTSERFIQANYYGVIIPPEDSPFTKVKLGDYGNSYTYACLDPSLEGSDYTALALAQRYDSFVAIRGYLWKKPWSECLPDIERICFESRVRYLFFEQNSIGKAGYEYIRIQGCMVEGFRTSENKIQKISRLSGYVSKGGLKIDINSDGEFIKQFQRWNSSSKSQYDDAADAVAMLINNIGGL
ncbi:MAG: hypothetical protein ACRCYP_00900, partial [Alphaproteobacteria bacterium]